MAMPMPDGTSLARVLRSHDQDSICESVRQRRSGGSTKRGKDLQIMLVSQRLHHAALSAGAGASLQATHELTELRALEAVGVRRRRRWLNDRILREMHGPMTVQDMERQFQPVPFGWREPSALEVISRPQHQRVWDSFRTIEPDTQQRVLERWEQPNHEQQRRPRAAATATAAGVCGSGGVEAAALALQRWLRMSRKARAALRKASVNTVVALEQQVLDFVEAGLERALCLTGLDSWGRLLVHGLADFYGLSSASPHSGAPALPSFLRMAVLATPAAAARAMLSAAPAGAQLGPAGRGALQQGSAPKEAEKEEHKEGELVLVAAAAVPALAVVQEEEEQGGVGRQEGGRRDEPPAMFVWHTMSKVVPTPLPSITCSDVLAALREVGTGSLAARELHAFVRRHLHGSDAAEWVVL